MPVRKSSVVVAKVATEVTENRTTPISGVYCCVHPYVKVTHCSTYMYVLTTVLDAQITHANIQLLNLQNILVRKMLLSTYRLVNYGGGSVFCIRIHFELVISRL